MTLDLNAAFDLHSVKVHDEIVGDINGVPLKRVEVTHPSAETRCPMTEDTWQAIMGTMPIETVGSVFGVSRRDGEVRVTPGSFEVS